MVLVDTGPLVALCDPRDAKHGLALKQLQRVAAAGLVTCEAVLVEACFHLPYDSQRRRLNALITELRVESLSDASDRPLWREVFDWLMKYSDHEPDWADGCLAVLSGRHKQLRVWTFDSEFRHVWRRPDGTPIPLAAKVARS
jgi:uncharacterized protein